MLCRYDSVSPGGAFSHVGGSSAGDKLHYVSMLFTRGNLIRQAGGALARAATIAARYSCVRRQGFLDNSSGSMLGEERVVMDYGMQVRTM
jgi:acyl-CoA oxidase